MQMLAIIDHESPIISHRIRIRTVKADSTTCNRLKIFFAEFNTLGRLILQQVRLAHIKASGCYNRQSGIKIGSRFELFL